MAERHKPKLVVQTRSPDVLRDCDLFREIDGNGGRVQVNMTVTTDDEDVRRAFEPFCPSNTVRLRAIAEVQNAGVDACITDDADTDGQQTLRLCRQPYWKRKVKKFIIQPFPLPTG